MPHRTEAWVLYAGESDKPTKAEFVRQEIEIPDITDEEVLARPLYGCWEGNMGHALERRPIDVPKQRGEPWVVMGNAGVVEILAVGANVTTVKPGDTAIIFCNGEWDEYGYPKKIFGFDARGTIGCMAKLTRLHQKQVIRVEAKSDAELAMWAGFSLRYPTAWSNFRLAYGTLRLQLTEEELPTPIVCGWGGGVSLAELQLANHFGCKTIQIASRDDRLQMARDMGILAIDRNEFGELQYDEDRYKTDAEYRERYKAAEKRFLARINELTEGKGVNIFLDYVGSPVIRATLKAMARQGVLATAGWKEGMFLWFMRAIECIDRHQHIHTHYARYSEGVECVKFAVEHNWLPSVDNRIYSFDDVPTLAADYDRGDFTYFPIFKVN